MRRGCSESTAAIVLAGGTGRRLGGADKAGLRVGESTLLDGVLNALGSVEDIVVVGAARPAPLLVRWTREHPPGSGPAAGVAAGMRLLPNAATVLLCACDLVGFTRTTADRLLGTLYGEPDRDGVVLRDGHGHDQWLASVWRAPALRRVLPEQVAGRSMGGLLGRLRFASLAARPGEASDIDTPEQLRAARKGR